jgi:hypothetical protein
MSVLHRVDDMWSMPAARFVRLVERLGYYSGLIRERGLEQRAAEQADTEPDDTGDLSDAADVIDFGGG